MKIRSVTITNFRSFRGTQRFAFPDGPGLYFLWGQNLEEPRLDANGSGKTSLWEAMYWCFFGTTTSGLKAGDVANWEVGKKTEVKVELRTEEHGIVFVTRTWSPNSWEWRDLFGNVVDLTKDETNPLAATLRLGPKPFMSTVLMAQGQRMFLDLEATEKAALFAEVMDLDRWLRYSQRSSDLARDADNSARAAESRVARVEGRVEQLRNQDTRAELDKWEKDRERRLDNLVLDFERKVRQKEKAEAALKEAREELARRKNHYEEALADSEKHEKTCTKCGQALPNPERSGKLRAALADVDDMERRVRQHERDIAFLDKDLDAMESEEDRILAEKNPFEDADRRRTRDLEDAVAELADLRAQLDHHNEQYALHSYWVRWFKEIRLGLIAESLRHLEVEVNSCLSELGLPGWELLFDVDRENKSGGISRGFSVTVRSPHNEKAVPWKAWSGGESQRLRIAANMGLANLIRSRTGSTVNLEVWDEATQWLSGQGVQDLLDALAARAEHEQRQIWVVDHRTLGYAGFKGSAGVVKTAAGSVFDQGTLPEADSGPARVPRRPRRA